MTTYALLTVVVVVVIDLDPVLEVVGYTVVVVVVFSVGLTTVVIVLVVGVIVVLIVVFVFGLSTTHFSPRLALQCQLSPACHHPSP